jgi:hypothetical protein
MKKKKKKENPHNHNTRYEAELLRALIRGVLRATGAAGLSVSQITKKVRDTLEATRYALKRMREEGQVKMTGSRATARWHYKKSARR